MALYTFGSAQNYYKVRYIVGKDTITGNIVAMTIRDARAMSNESNPGKGTALVTYVRRAKKTEKLNAITW